MTKPLKKFTGGSISMAMPAPDTAAQEQASKATNQGFERLAEPFRREIKLHCYLMLGSVHEAEDVVQETYLRAWRGFNSFDGRGSFRAWLYRIATNECLSYLNKKKKRFFLPIEDVGQQLISKLDSSAHISGDDIQKKLQEAVLRLPVKQRLVFNLKYFEEMPYEEMSRVLDTSEGALKASYHHAVKKIEDYIINR